MVVESTTANERLCTTTALNSSPLEIPQTMRNAMIKCIAYALAAPFAVATPASARNFMNWDCGDDVTVNITVTAAHKTVLRMKKTLLAGVAAMLLATGAAHAEDRSLRFIEGWYCSVDRDVPQLPPPQRFYKRGFCKDFPSNSITFTRRGTVSLRDVECKF
jgi:hypothetical protein